MIKGRDIDDFKRFYFGLDQEKPIQILLNSHGNKDEGWFDMHYELELGVVVKGSMVRSYLGYETEIGPGDVWFCNMWEPHGFEVFEAPCEVVVFVIDPKFCNMNHFFDRDFYAPFMVPPMDRPIAGAKIKEKIKNLGKEAQRRFSENYTLDWAKLYLSQLLLLLLEKWEAPEQDPEYTSRASIQGALRLIFEERRLIPTKEAALACNMSVTKFTTQFKDLMGTTFSDFALQYRVKGAAFQLKTSNLTQQAVALNWGFTDASHLHKYLNQ